MMRLVMGAKLCDSVYDDAKLYGHRRTRRVPRRSSRGPTSRERAAPRTGGEGGERYQEPATARLPAQPIAELLPIKCRNCLADFYATRLTKTFFCSGECRFSFGVHVRRRSPDR